MSVQTVVQQRAFAARVGLPYRLVSDPRLRLAAALGLPTFSAEGRTFYRRLTLVGSGRRLIRVFGQVLKPKANAEEVIAWLETGVSDEREEGVDG